MDLEQFLHRYEKTAEEWATLDGEANRLEELKKIINAEIFNQAEGSAAQRERVADAHPSYREHVETMVAARTKANVARSKMRSMEMKFESWRTRNATKRAQMNLR